MSAVARKKIFIKLWNAQQIMLSQAGAKCSCTTPAKHMAWPLKNWRKPWTE